VRAAAMTVVGGLAAPTADHASDSPSSTAVVITEPDWLRRPTGEELERFWPAQARGMSGRAVISCTVTVRGLLDDCSVTSEVPPGHGFGGAALLLAPSFLMRPLMKDGVPVGGAQVNIPISFKSGGVSTSDYPSEKVARSLPWGETPTTAAMAAAFPHTAYGRVPSGHVLLRCRVADKGRLGQCRTASEVPPDRGFAQAALNLVKDFRVAPNRATLEGARELSVDIPFDFRDPSVDAPAVEIVSPEWLVGPDPKMAGKLFPLEAAKAGLKTGVAILACAVSHEGKLVDCTVASESPSGLGFGKSALAIAGVMAMNPWTPQGIPVDGAHIRVPIRLNLAKEEPPAPPPAPGPSIFPASTP
jgi:TonB family protein